MRSLCWMVVVAACGPERPLAIAVDASSTTVIWYIASPDCVCTSDAAWPSENACVDRSDVVTGCPCQPASCMSSVRFERDHAVLASTSKVADSGLLQVDASLGGTIVFDGCDRTISAEIPAMFPPTPAITSIAMQPDHTTLVQWTPDPSTAYLVFASFAGGFESLTCRTAIGAGSFDLPVDNISTNKYGLKALSGPSTTLGDSERVDVWTSSARAMSP